MWLWHLGIWVRGGLGSGGLNVGLGDPGDLFQPNQFYDSVKIEGSAKGLVQTGCQRSWNWHRVMPIPAWSCGDLQWDRQLTGQVFWDVSLS